MLASEAIRQGITFRGESHAGPFVRIANTEELRSDVWGAACEAVHSLIAKRNWDKSNTLEYSKDIEALREIQQKYFADYFKMPATCPGALPRHYKATGVRIVDRHGNTKREGEKEKALPAITTICPSITNLAELLEHVFYVHNWSREECAQACAWYEHFDGVLGPSVMIENFEHYQDEAVRRRVSDRLTLEARRRERQRHSRRQVFFTN